MSFKSISTMAATATFVMLGAFSAEAAKDRFYPIKPHVNVGSVGHIGHRKTVVRQRAKIKINKLAPTNQSQPACTTTYCRAGRNWEETNILTMN